MKIIADTTLLATRSSSSEEDPSTQRDAQKDISVAQVAIVPKLSQCNFDDESTTDIDFEMSSQARSTLADALHCLTRVEVSECSEVSSSVSIAQPVSGARVPTLCPFRLMP